MLPPLTAIFASKTPKTRPETSKWNPWSEKDTSADAVTPSSATAPDTTIFGTAVALSSSSRCGPGSVPAPVSENTSPRCSGLREPLAEIPDWGSTSTFDVALSSARCSVPPTRRPWSYLIRPIVVFCGTT